MMTQSKNKPRSQPKSRFLLALAVVTTSLCVAGTEIAMSNAAYAAAFEDYPSKKVYYHDLNLANDRGVARLHGRIRRAARDVCGEDVWPTLGGSRAIKKCRDAATRNAMAQADQKIVLYRAQRLASD
jgi:UrcA family protein